MKIFLLNLSLLYSTCGPVFAQDFDSYYPPATQSQQYQQNSGYPLNGSGGFSNPQAPSFYYQQPRSLSAPTYNSNQFGGYNNQQSTGFNNQQQAQFQGFANQQAPSFNQQQFNQQQYSNFNQPQQRPNLFQLMRMANGAQQMPQQSQQQTQMPGENPFGMRNLMKTFFDGGASTGPAGAAGDQQALNTARSYCQTARDQASQAEGCESRTRYGDKGARLSAASAAQNHASAARGAANSATSAAAGHFSAANDAAAQARNAADRAQAAADRARYNANSAN